MQMKSISSNYVAVQGWMVEELGLKGNELLAYALVYGFSQDGGSAFTGSVAYVQRWLGCARQTVFNVLQSLEKRGLIRKEERIQNGMKFCCYRAVAKKLDRGSKSCTEGVQNLDKSGLNFGPNNIYNIEDNIGGVSFEDVWGLYGKGNVDVARRAWNALGDEVRGLVYGHLVGDDGHVGYLEATEVDGRKWRKNFENYLSSECWKQALRERELLNIELV